MADVNARIKLELVDGPAQKALADFVKSSTAADKAVSGLTGSLKKTKAGADSTSLSFKGFADIIVNDIGDKGTSSMGRFASLLSGPVALALGSALTAGFALKKVFDFTVLAEKNEQIANSFNAIAASAGLAGDSLREGLVSAAQGLADDDDLLQAANKSIIELGSNANKIPEIMEIARKSTALFGGDLIQNFENLSQALASGNTRALRNIGLVIDAEAAQQKYAASIGVTVSQLSEAGKRQAITNAALEQANIKFADVDESTAKASKAFKRLQVAGGELYDGIAELVSQSSTLSSIFSAFEKGVKAVTPAKTITEEYKVEIEKLGSSITALNREMDQYKKQLEGTAPMQASTALLKTRISALEKLKEETQKNIDIKKAFISATQEEALKNRKVGPASKPLENQVNQQALVKSRQESARLIAESDLAIARESANLQVQIVEDRLARQEISEFESIAMRAEIDSQRRIAEQEAAASRFLAENEALQVSLDQELLTRTEYFAKRDALANQYAADTLKRNADEVRAAAKRDEDLKKLDVKKFNAVKDTFGNLSVLMQTSSRELFAIGKAAAIAQATMNTYEAITKTMASVPYPFNIPLAAAQGIAGFVQVSNIASTNPSFATGGIVPGNSYSGDRVQANVNSGEMILNRQQQSNLFNQIKSGGGDSSRMESLLGAIYGAIESQPIVVNVGGKTVVDTLRSELKNGRSFE